MSLSINTVPISLLSLLSLLPLLGVCMFLSLFAVNCLAFILLF